ncbi:MAG: spermidine/putrescine ABC transporter substrate-binding protein [Geminicoccaceae bacterium]|nr:spermidine/putrescine ABC transporter substrate-binding protein [Geminicoccaceae bacterium]
MSRRPSPFPMPFLSRRHLLGNGVAIAATTSAFPRLAAAQNRQVNIYNWDTYIGETTVADFTEATGIEVRYDLFASNDELFSKLREGNPGYDVIFPSNDWVERMIVAGLLNELDHAKIPHFANVDPVFANPTFDPGRAHSMPYMWGTMGIGYRKSVAEVHSWKDLLTDSGLTGRVSLLDDKHVVQMGLKYLGFSLNSRDPAEISAAADAIIAAKQQVKAFSPDTGQDLLISGEVDACQEWSGDILQVMTEDDDLQYVVPEEGGNLWEDTMAIPKGAPHVEEAHEWINYILDAKVHASIAAYIQYACPNAAAMEFIPEADRDNPAIYPPREVLERCETLVYKGEEVESLYDDALTRILAA